MIISIIMFVFIITNTITIITVIHIRIINTTSIIPIRTIIINPMNMITSTITN